ncbi:MAG: hypothetical protein WCG85_05820 [Polyangia bacterium]
MFSVFFNSTTLGQVPDREGNTRHRQAGLEVSGETEPSLVPDAPAPTVQGSRDGSATETVASRFLLERRLIRLEEQLASTKLLGAILAGIMALLGVLNIIKELIQRKDYKNERKFYEQRVLNAEDRQDSAATKNGQVLSEQIDNIQKLGGVIGLLRDTYELQLKREEAQSALVKRLEATDALVSQMRNDSRDRYRNAGKIFRDSFGSVKAMAWPSLSLDLVNLANRARAQLESTPRFIIDEERKDNPATFARVMQLAGTSAFYANDIDAALHSLKEADDTFSTLQASSDTVNARAYTKHFRGIAEKNWRLSSAQAGENLLEAKTLLEQAVEIFGRTSKQFLTMITLAEVMSYLGEDTDALLSEMIERLEQLKGTTALDGNQRTLLTRAYLLRGNSFALRNDRIAASKWYEKAVAHDPKSYYAHLSVAEAGGSDGRDVGDSWRTGFRLLEDSGATRRREITTRVTALAWGLVAAAKLGDADARERYGLELATIQQSGQVGGRVPLFFSPISKQLLDLDALVRELPSRLDKTTAADPGVPKGSS